MQFPKILLASKSPRRHEILSKCDLEFEVVNIEANEDFPSVLKNEEVCEYLALHKANHYLPIINNNEVLVTADTIVCIDNLVLNKPANSKEAFEMLSRLSGRIHDVYTGVCIKNANKTHVFHDVTEVEFYPLTEVQIMSYIKNCQPYDKAGSYGIQDWMGYLGVKRINGCYFNVMGFPSGKFYRELSQFILPS